MPLTSSSSLLLIGEFQSTWMNRCNGKRVSSSASGVLPADTLCGQKQFDSRSYVTPILFFGVAWYVRRPEYTWKRRGAIACLDVSGVYTNEFGLFAFRL